MRAFHPLRSLWELLTAPHPAITDIETRRQSRLLSALILGSTAVLVVYVCYGRIFEDFSVGITTAILLFSAVGIVQYLLNRRGWVRVASWLYIGLSFLTIHFLPLTHRASFVLLFFIFIVLLVSAIVLSARMTFGLFIASLVIQGVVAVFDWRVDEIEVNNGTGIFFTALMGTLILVFMQHRAGLERERQIELRDANTALRASEITLEKRVMERTHDLEVTAEISRMTSSLLDIDTLLVAVVDQTRRSFQFQSVSIWLYDAGADRLTRQASSPATLTPDAFEVKSAKGPIPDAARRHAPVLIHAPGDTIDIPDSGSVLVLPLLLAGDLIGVLELQADRLNQFDSNDQRVLKLFAEQLAVAVNNARLYERAERERRRTQRLATLNLQITQAATEQEILAAIAGITNDRNPSFYSLTYVHYDGAPTPQRIDVVAMRGADGSALPLGPLEQRRFVVNQGTLLRHLFERNEPLFTEDVGSDPRWDATDRATAEMFGGRSVIMVPLKSRGRYQALTTVIWEQPRNFDQDVRDEINAMMPRLADNIAGRRAYLNVQEAREQTERLYRAGERMNSAQGYQAIVEVIAEYLDDPHYNIALNTFDTFNRDTAEQFSVVALRPAGSPVVIVPGIQFPASYITAWGGAEVFIVEDMRDPQGVTDPDTRAYFLENGVNAMILVWLKVGEHTIGALNLTRPTPHRFTAQETESAYALAQLSAAAVDRHRLYVEQIQIADQLRQLDRLKSQFLASMSHELRTPLNAILNFTEFVAVGMLGAVNPAQVDALNKSLGSGRHLLSLINDVLDVAKIQAGMMTLFIEDGLNLCDELKIVAETAETLLADRPVRLIRDIDPDLPLVSGDCRRIRQVLLNLVSNATKFTEKGTVTLSAKVRAREILFAVIDTGPGISAGDQATIFEPFRQTESGLRHGGTGLGLAISRNLAEAHGGRLWVESAPGEGAAFFFTLPRGVKPGQAPASTPIEALPVLTPVSSSTALN